MFLDLYAMHLLDDHRANEAHRLRNRDDLHRQALREAHEANRAEAARAAAASHGTSGDVARVALGDGAGGRGDTGSDLGRSEHLHPASRT
jgi:hypothetical protein